MDDILFTCAGTSDPVRGNRDGGILHIMRYYHPKEYISSSASKSPTWKHKITALKRLSSTCRKSVQRKASFISPVFLCIIASCVTPPR